MHDANIPVRKLAHVSEFAILYILSRRAIARSVRRPVLADLLALLLSFLFAASDEWHQAFVPGRSAKWADVLVDMIGVAAAWLALLGWRTRFSTASEAAEKDAAGG